MSDVVTSFETSFESRGFLWLVILGSAGGVALTIANAIEYNRAKTDCNSVSSNTANVLLWLNIILAVILAIIFIWAIYRLLIHPKTKVELVKKPSVTALKIPVTSTSPTHVLIPTSNTAASNLVLQGTPQAVQYQVQSAQ
uniref:Transmembrane protein n=1 Tax=Pithovirus LCPAC201 TaxID=2506591 RepID=A0A481Z4F2_9VIRU|nr:MAG: uncharacterized protein LCPAC201_00690 [Pithovirus LCPAC201]